MIRHNELSFARRGALEKLASRRLGSRPGHLTGLLVGADPEDDRRVIVSFDGSEVPVLAGPHKLVPGTIVAVEVDAANAPIRVLGPVTVRPEGLDEDLPTPEAIVPMPTLAVGEMTDEDRARLAQAAAEAAQAKADLATAEASLSASLTELDQRLSVFGDETIPGLEEKIDGAIIDAETEYKVGTSETIPPTGDWSIIQPPRVPGSFVWMRNRIYYADGTSTTSEPALLTGNAGEAGTDAVLLRIDSTRGTAFKNNAISTVLTVTVFNGAQRISTLAELHGHFGPAAYLEWHWRRKDDTGFGIISSADPRIGAGGFTLTVSPADVDEQTVFQAILNT